MDWVYVPIAIIAGINFVILAVILKISKNMQKLHNTTDSYLLTIENKVNEQLEKGFRETNETFMKVGNSLAKIDEAQKHIEHLNKETASLQEILEEKKIRVNYGEIQIHSLLASVFGEDSDIYKIYHRIGNVTFDVLLKLPEPLGNIGVNADFPLESYNKMTDKTSTRAEADEAEKTFRNDIKEHIDNINGKYIIPHETSAHAIMFVPSESIFSYMHAYNADILEYAGAKSVWVVSPTIFMALLTTIQVTLKNSKKDKYTHEIYNEMDFLEKNFKQYGECWTTFSKNIGTVYKDVKGASVMTVSGETSDRG